MPGIDATIPLGVKVPDATQNLSNLLSIGNAAQQVQQGSISLNERKAVQGVLADPSNYTDEQGNIDFNRALPAVMRAAPTTGIKYVQDLMTAQKQQTDAKQSLNNLTTDARTQIGKVLYGLPPDATPDLVNKTLDTMEGLYKGSKPFIDSLRLGYSHSQQNGQGADFIARAARTTLPAETQQTMETPSGITVDTGATAYGVNLKPGVPGVPVGGVIPGTSVQKQVPPTQPVVGPNNQPGVMGPHGTAPKAGTVPTGYNGYDGGSPQAAAPEQLRIMGEERAKAAAQGDQATVAALDREMARITTQTGVRPQGQGGFIPTAPAQGSDASKAGTVQIINQHWSNLNTQAENSQLLEGLIGNIKSLAPGAITGTEAGRRSYVTGLLNALHLGNQATGDMQRDTDLLEKNIAQLGLNTPATTDAMRTIVGLARPHSTMSAAAIEEASAQLLGQIQANRAIRNALASPKQIADQTGDTTAYQNVRQHMEEIADPRAWEFEALSPAGRKAMLSKLTPEDRATLRSKIEALSRQGLLK